MMQRRTWVVCSVTNCTCTAHNDGLCFHHYMDKQMQERHYRREFSPGEREWYAEQGRRLDEAAMLDERFMRAAD